MAEVMTTISISIAKSNYILFDSLRSALKKFNDLELLGEYNSYQDAVNGLIARVPHVFLLNIQIGPEFEESLHQETGLELLKHIKNNQPHTKVIILANTKKKSIVRLVHQYDVAAYLLPDVSINVLKIAIDEVAAGNTFFPREIRAIIDGLDKKENGGGSLQLSTREREVLRLVSTGYSTPAIASELNLHKDTVSDYRDALMKKLRAKNAPDLIRLAYEQRLL